MGELLAEQADGRRQVVARLGGDGLRHRLRRVGLPRARLEERGVEQLLELDARERRRVARLREEVEEEGHAEVRRGTEGTQR